MKIDRSSLTPEEKRALLERLLRERGAGAPSDFPLSVGQQALWFIHESAEYNPAFHLILSFHVRGDLDVDALGRAVERLVDRHAILRTRIDGTGEVPMHRFEGAKSPELEVIDASGWTETDLEAAVERSKLEPFALTSGPLLRVRLFTTSKDDHQLVLVLHHLVGDAVSISVVLGELNSDYEALRMGLAPASRGRTTGYADFVAWQQKLLASADGDRQWAYWKNKLSGELPVLALPAPAGSVDRGFGTHALELSSSTVLALRELARTEGVTMPVLLLAAYYVLLYRHTRQRDMLIGMPSLGRSKFQFQRTVGYFTDPVVMRVPVSGDLGFREFLHAVRGEVTEAMANQDIPFATLVERLRVPRSGSTTPVFQTMFNFIRGEGLQELAGTQSTVQGGSSHWIATEVGQRPGQFDLDLLVVDQGEALDVRLGFNKAAIDSEQAERVLDRFGRLLREIVDNPSARVGEMSVLSSDERRRMLVEWNATSRPYPSDKCVHDLIQERALAEPEETAVIAEAGATLTYGELERRSNQLARYLQSIGVGAEVRVGICLERSAEMVVALLGVLKAGGAYVPMDPAFPPQRLRHMQEAGGLPVVIMEEATASLLPDSEAKRVVIDREWDLVAAQPEGALETRVDPRQSAYVLFTSGSTGTPKGVVIEHRALVNFLWSMQREPGLEKTDRLVSVTTLSFDIAGLELYLPLITGAGVVLASTETAYDGRRLIELLERHDATILQGTPATWRMLLEAGWEGKPDLKMLVGGEALPASLVEQLLPRGKELWNMYGPTETTIWSSVGRITSAGDIHIGRPIDNTQMYVLDDRLQPVPPGVVGTLYIGGDGVARGYLDQPELTAARFLPNPFLADGSRIYDTGDLARYRNDGVLECLGRSDSQVKVRGFRIELGEIETVLEDHASVRQAVVVVTGEEAMARLSAFYVAEESGSVTAAELRAHAKTRLPDYMVPGHYMELEELPLTPNGKIDRKALAQASPAAARTEAYVAPRTDLERTIASIWSEVLEVEQIGVHDNFFELGGHSLVAARVVARLSSELDVELSLQSFFDAPTVAEQTILITRTKSALVDEARLRELLLQLDELSDQEIQSQVDLN